jgi:hypothetical protein
MIYADFLKYVGSRGGFSLPGGSYSLTAVPTKVEASPTGLELSRQSGSERVNYTP